MHDIAELEREADAVNTLIATRATPVGGPPRGGSGRPSLAPLPADTVLVSYWLGSESAYAWVVSPAENRWAQLPSPAADRGEGRRVSRSLTRLIDMPLERRLQDARALYELDHRRSSRGCPARGNGCSFRTAPSTMSLRSAPSYGR